MFVLELPYALKDVSSRMQGGVSLKLATAGSRRIRNENAANHPPSVISISKC
jgi:hypothetical protein